MGEDPVNEHIFLSLVGSLALTLALECCYAIFWGIRRRDVPLLLLVNLLTNPVVVLCHHVAAALWPAGLAFVPLALEVWAVGTEGYLYRARSEIHHPWRFSLSANLLSYAMGCLL